MNSRDLLWLALRDPERLVEQLVPAWAVPPEALKRIAQQVREAARWAQANRAPESFLKALQSLLSSVPLRPEVVRRMRRPAPPKPKSLDLSLMMEEVARRYTHLRRSGRTFVGLCPIHTEKNPSFHVYPDGHFHCYGCGAHGDAADLVAAVEGISRKKAIELLTGR